MDRVAAVVLDVEGTTTPIAFVHEVLFPYARARMAALVEAGGPEVDAALEQVPGPDRLSTLLGWMDADVKATPLKALQGLAWREGYADGSLRGAIYPDVAPALMRWRAEGVRLFVYSSGSVEAQRQLFRHSAAGDLAGLFEAHFDTTTGPKREAASYGAIAAAAGMAPGAMLFLSDVVAELDAAAGAGMRTCQLVRAEDGTVAGAGHATATDLDEVGAAFGLP